MPPPSPFSPPPHQAPTKTKDVKDLEDFKSSYFYAQNGAMVFKMKGKKARSELRFNKEWKVSTSRTRRMVGELTLARPSSSMDEFTWMQVHGGSDAGKPLLRLTWDRERKQGGKKYTDVLVAKIRRNTKTGTLFGGGGVGEGCAPRGASCQGLGMSWGRSDADIAVSIGCRQRSVGPVRRSSNTFVCSQWL